MFAQRLQRARKAAGLSMNKLAQEVGVSANAIKKYEHGINMPSSSNLPPENGKCSERTH